MARKLTESPLLSPSEWEIFYVISKNGPLTIREVKAELARRDPTLSLAYTTVLKFAQRIASKGYLEQRKGDGGEKAHLFSPTISFDVALRRQTERFLHDIAFDDPEELRSIRALIDERLSDLDES